MSNIDRRENATADLLNRLRTEYSERDISDGTLMGDSASDEVVLLNAYPPALKQQGDG